MNREFEAKLETRLRAWEVQIDELLDKARTADTDMQLAYHREIAAIRATHDAAKQKLIELKATEENDRAALTDEVEAVWDSLAEAIKSAETKTR